MATIMRHDKRNYKVVCFKGSINIDTKYDEMKISGNTKRCKNSCLEWHEAVAAAKLKESSSTYPAAPVTMMFFPSRRPMLK